MNLLTAISCLIIVTLPCEGLSATNGKQGRPRDPGLQPGKLFQCGLLESQLHTQRQACRQKFHLQEAKHHCATKKLTMNKVDKHLSKMEKSVMLNQPQNIREELEKCQQEKAARDDRIANMKEDIAVIRKKMVEMHKIKSEKEKNIETLGEIRVQLETDTKLTLNTTQHLRQSVVALRQATQRRNVTLLSSQTTHAANATIAAVHMLEVCTATLQHELDIYINCSSVTHPQAIERLDTRQRIATRIDVAKRNITGCERWTGRCGSHEVTCNNAVDESKAQLGATQTAQQRLTEQLATCTDSLTGRRNTNRACAQHLAKDRQSASRKMLDMAQSVQRWQRRVVQRQQCEQAHNTCVAATRQHLRQIAVDSQHIQRCGVRTQLCRQAAADCADASVGGTRRTRDAAAVRGPRQTRDAAPVRGPRGTRDAAPTGGGDIDQQIAAAEREDGLCRRQLQQLRRQLAGVTDRLVWVRRRLQQSDELDACYGSCPQLKPAASAADAAGCPQHGHAERWHRRPTGCFLTTRTVGPRHKMQAYCANKTVGAGLAEVGSPERARDAQQLIENMADKFWVRRADALPAAVTAATPPPGAPCSGSDCRHCWMLAVQSKGGLQKYPCFENLPAVCFVAANE